MQKSAGCLPDACRQKAHDMFCDRLDMLFEGEVSRVKKVDFRVRNVSFESFRAGGNEEGVVLAPHRQHRRLDPAQGLVPLWIARNIVLVVVDQAELYFRVARTI